MAGKTARKFSRDWSIAIAHLREKDPKLAAVIDHVGPCTLAPRRGYFLALCRAIIAQQISTKAAQSVMRKFKRLFPGGRPTPKALLKLSTPKLRGAGLSRQKAEYLRGIAKAFSEGTIPTRKLPRMSDEEVIETLVQLKGIGRWTAEMFLIFVLCRENVYPVDDLGLQVNAGRLLGGERIRGEVLLAHGEKWHPYRSIATWYLWRGGDMLRERKK
jgi:DNA-3-methyladenine glycosylase II